MARQVGHNFATIAGLNVAIETRRTDMTYRAIILCNPGQDAGNIDITFYAESDKAAERWVERFMAQVGLRGGWTIAKIAN